MKKLSILIIFLAVFSWGFSYIFTINYWLAFASIVGAYIIAMLYYAFKHGNAIVDEAERRNIHPKQVLDERRKKKYINQVQKQQKDAYEQTLDDDIDEDAIRKEVMKQLANTPVVIQGPQVTAKSEKPFGNFNGFPLHDYIVLNHVDIYAYEGTTQFNPDGTPVAMIAEDEICLEAGVIYKYSHKVSEHNERNNSK